MHVNERASETHFHINGSACLSLSQKQLGRGLIYVTFFGKQRKKETHGLAIGSMRNGRPALE